MALQDKPSCAIPPARIAAGESCVHAYRRVRTLPTHYARPPVVERQQSEETLGFIGPSRGYQSLVEGAGLGSCSRSLPS